MNHVLTLVLARKIEKAETNMFISRLQRIKEQPGNPMGVDIEKFGNAVAFSSKVISGPSFNTVKGIAEDDTEYVDSILGFYKNREIAPRFEISPSVSSGELFKRIHRKGLYQRDFHTSLYVPVEKRQECYVDSSISIRQLNKDEFDLFADIYVRGFQMPKFLTSAVAQNNVILHDKENWYFYLAFVDNHPAGIGVLFLQNDIATLAASATLPEYRNKGVHMALVQRRMDDARENGAVFIVGQAAFGSTSQHNMERAGLNIAYTKAIWVQE